MMYPGTPVPGVRYEAGSLYQRDQPREGHFILTDTFSKNKVSHSLILEYKVSH